jgi:hypothetical protein
VLVDARDVDDRALPAGLDHALCGALPGHERAGQVGVDHVLPVVDRLLEERLVDARSGVVYEHVDLAELVRQVVDHLGRVALVVDVQVVERGAAALRLDLLNGAARALLVTVECDPDVVSGIGQSDGRGLSDSGVRSGDDRNRHELRASTQAFPCQTGGIGSSADSYGDASLHH